MKQTPYARKKRQLKSLSQKLRSLWEVRDEDVSSQIKTLLAKIRRLVKELSNVFSGSYLRKVMGATAFVLFVSLAGNVNAQNFGAPQLNPFGLDSIPGYFADPDFADMDNDGDLDLIAGDYYGNINYFENTGSPSSPQFAPVQVNPFGITQSYMAFPEIADFDNDGDYDLLLGEYYYNSGFKYFENTGTNTNPQFGAAQINPFGLDTLTHFVIPTAVDLDDDGDLDILAGDYMGNLNYFENIGTANNPNYAAPLENPMGLSSGLQIASPEFADLDHDGDFDLIVSSYYGMNYYYENIGTPSNPDFAAPVTNPFGLDVFSDYIFPAFADLDDDGDMDLLAGQYDGIFLYCENLEITGQKEITNNTDVSVFPNPAQNIVKISSQSEIERVEFRSVTGRLVKIDNKTEIPLNDIRNGVYLINIIFDDGSKIVKKISKI